MDTHYGIAVTNKFALFIDEDEDPLEILRQQEELLQKKKEGKGKDTEKGKSSKDKKAKKTVLQPETKNKPQEQSVPKKEGKYFAKMTQHRDFAAA
jgi:plasminogen activator inhibitor 1 RNA-binding protein